jgi:hypothetical protein
VKLRSEVAAVDSTEALHPAGQGSGHGPDAGILEELPVVGIEADAGAELRAGQVAGCFAPRRDRDDPDLGHLVENRNVGFADPLAQPDEAEIDRAHSVSQARLNLAKVTLS